MDNLAMSFIEQEASEDKPFIIDDDNSLNQKHHISRANYLTISIQSNIRKPKRRKHINFHLEHLN
jgi:hypothetical protein